MPEHDAPVRRLDARQPLVIDTRQLGRRPGSMRRLSRSVPAPVDLGVAVLGVPAGSPVQLELRLESVMEGVLVSGSAETQLEGECVRCLDPIARPLAVDLQELFAYPGARGENDEDSELSQMEGDLLDLEPVLRDAVVLALPFQPVCREDCPGLCAQCGVHLAQDPGHQHELPDSRWAALNGLADLTALHASSGPTEVPEPAEER